MALNYPVGHPQQNKRAIETGLTGVKVSSTILGRHNITVSSQFYIIYHAHTQSNASAHPCLVVHL